MDSDPPPYFMGMHFDWYKSAAEASRRPGGLTTGAAAAGRALGAEVVYACPHRYTTWEENLEGARVRDS